MTNSLLATLKSQFGDDLIDLLSRLTGEQPALTQTAFERSGEAILAGLLGQGATAEGSQALVNLLNEPGFRGHALTDLPAVLGDSTSAISLIDQGKVLLHSLFGDRIEGLVRWVSNSSGVGQGSAWSMMSLIAPAVLNFIKGQFSGKVDGSGLWNYLSGQRSGLETSAPAAGLLPVLGWQDWSSASAGAVAPTPQPVRAAPPIVTPTPVPEERERSAFPWYWLVLLLGLLLLGFLLMRGCNPGPEAVTTSAPAPVVKEPAAPVAATPVTPKPVVIAPAPVQPVELVLRDDVKLMVSPDGVERKLVTFIEDPNKVPDETTWFSFDGLEFETGSATLKPSSQARLEQLAAVLKAYPLVRIKIGGYTDNVGDPAMNLKLSQDRAQTAMQGLVNLGVTADRMEAEGYGEQYPIADNATEEGREQNRRIDIRVTAKPEAAAAAAAVAVTPASTTVVTPTVSATEPVELVLRGNIRLMVAPEGIERKMVAFIEDTHRLPDLKTWFTFDGLDFETASARISSASKQRLEQVAAVLKAYPSVNIKLGGYTDNVGNPAMNLKLSDDRAKAAMKALVDLGIAANRMEAEGYGEQHPIADNTTEEGRQRNRRVDVRITAK